jgi:hypothetical protein
VERAYDLVSRRGLELPHRGHIGRLVAMVLIQGSFVSIDGSTVTAAELRGRTAQITNRWALRLDGWGTPYALPTRSERGLAASSFLLINSAAQTF